MTVNADNLYLLLPGIVNGIARLYAAEHSCAQIEALRIVYASDLYPQLADESTKLWHLGAVALYEALQSQKTN